MGGLPDQVAEALKARGKAIYRSNTYGAGQGITYDPETLKVIWETMAREAGVRIIFHSLVVDATREGDRITGVIAASKAGFYRLSARVVIDASGDADVAAAMGVPYEGAADGPVQALTTTFRLIYVDVERARTVKKDTLHSLMEEASESGEYDLPRREGSVHITPLVGVMATNMTRVVEVDPTDPLQLSEAESEGRRQAMEYFRFMKDMVPGYERRELSRLSTQIGLRESRRIYGEYRLSQGDVLAARKFEDAVAQCGAPIEEHHKGRDTRWEYLPEGETYQIPYRCLLPRGMRGLLVAGRCLSADHDAHASVRSMGQCMAMGQAAGTAAALAADSNTIPVEIPVSELQARLRQSGAML